MNYRLFRTAIPAISWLDSARIYLSVLLPGHLIWEIAQLPLYTLWYDSTWTQIAFAVAHCTAGDLLIGMSALALAVIVGGNRDWPQQRFTRVALLTVAIGLLYTLYSEWLNVEVRGAWAYAEAMPRLPWLGTGLAPLAQWLVIPALGFWQVARQPRRDRDTQ
jgi:hypothetical protein